MYKIYYSGKVFALLNDQPPYRAHSRPAISISIYPDFLDIAFMHPSLAL